VRIIRSSDYRRMPWKNGGGETVEIAISPAGASLDAFDWRISMAHVASNGPFSGFPGVDRTLVVLAGGGIRLKLPGDAVVSLSEAAAPFAFSGDDPVDAELIDGPIQDLNAMSRRTSHRHQLARIRSARPVHLRREGELLLVLVRDAAASARIGRREHALAAGDTIVLSGEEEPELEIAPAAPLRLFAIDLRRA